MTAAEIAAAKKTAGTYTCMLCLYSGPLAYGPGGDLLCQACQSGSPEYLIPNCPACGGIVRATHERRNPEFQCPKCGKHWDEPRGEAGVTPWSLNRARL